MNWIQSLSKAIEYIEYHLNDDITIDDVAGSAFSSVSHFQLIFHVVTGMTVGEYIRNRRLTLAGQDLLKPGKRIIDIAMRYGYDTQESFSKAFTRFHGVAPSKISEEKLKIFHPLTINVTIQGGFDMAFKFVDEFYLADWSDIKGEKGEENVKLTDIEKYNRVANWAGRARGRNPRVFDSLTQWLLDDGEWSAEKLSENEQILMHGVLARFKEQNARLREYLKELEPSGVVNAAVFKALDRFDDALLGRPQEELPREAVAEMFADFSAMSIRGVRENIAGGITGAAEVNHVEIYGYINHLKDCDAGVQWALFMPRKVQEQQKGFKVESFEYVRMPDMRFIGKECTEHDEADMSWELEIMGELDAMTEYKSGFDHDILFQHHYGKAVDAERWHGFWGRLMKAETPVPEGFIHFDFVQSNDGGQGAPFISQFALAKFAGDMEAMHSTEGYDSDAMYDITRNIMLAQGVNISYPAKYWTAEVFLDGCDKWSTAFLFSAEL